MSALAEQVFPLLRRLARAALAAALALLVFGPAAHAQMGGAPNVAVSLHSARAAVAPGERFTIVLRQQIRDGWHTYWLNPGDSGEPTEIVFAPTPGARFGPLQFPAPERIPFDILVNYGFSGEVLFPIEVSAPASARAGQTLPIRAHATWLVCSDICIPEEADVALDVPVAPAGADDPDWKARIDAALAALPAPHAEIRARITAREGGALLTFAGGPAIGAREAHFFPFRNDAIDHAAPENPSAGDEGVSLQLKPGAKNDLGEGALEGVLTLVDSSGAHRAFTVSAEPGAPLPNASGRSLAPAAGAGGLTLPVALLFAFIGGLILNIMPCVFPVLSLKALSLAKTEAGGARRAGVLFLLGCVTTFLALAGVLIALKAGGEAVGWGFQLQQPLVIASLATLFFVIGLNLAGVFEFGAGLQNLGGGLAARGGDAGAFFTGALAVVAATPCTAPFMAGATGFAATQPPPVTLAVFFALALGFAAPFTALAFAPALRHALPKPGAWMEKAKIVLAFPMFGTAVWLVWVLSAQTGPNGVLALLALLAAVSFFLVVGRWGVFWRAGAAALVLAFAVLGWRAITTPLETTHAELSAQAWSPARVAELIGEGKGVFVDFTATWCVTCQVNKAVALGRPRVAAAFAERGIVFLEADWTNKNAEIAAALAAHGRDGVPLYLYYPPGVATPRILPQVLTEDIIIQAITEETS